MGLCLSYAQEKNVNLIISIDEGIPTSNLMIQYISYKNSDGKIYRLDGINYVQGNLLISEDIFEKLISNSVEKISLHFDYWKYCKNEQISYSYEVELKQSYFKYEYIICHLFNLDKKKYKKIYFPISDDKNYTYYFDYPTNYGEKLIQKKYTREQKKCMEK